MKLLRVIGLVLGVLGATGPVSALPLQLEVPVLLSGIQSWSLPGSSADDFFALNGGSCTVNRVQVSCSSQISTTRASQESCTWADGHISYAANNTPCITDLGVQVFQASTNQALYARDMTQVAWTALNVTVAKTATGVDNVANTASLLTASAGNGTVLQTLTITSQAETYSVYIKCVTCTGNIQITENNGVAWTTCSGLSTTIYTRCQVKATLANPIVGIRIVNSGDSVDVDFNQDEELAFATPPIPTTSSTASRAADNIAAIGPLATAILNAKAARFVTNNGAETTVSGTAAKILSFTSTQWLARYESNTTISISDASNSATATIGNSGNYNSLVKSAVGFDTSSITVVANGGIKVTNANSIGSLSSPVTIGSSGGSNQFLNGNLLRMTFGPTKGQFDATTTGLNPQ